MKKLLSLAVLILISTLSFSQKSDDIIGVWLTEGGKSKIQITKSNGKYKGKILWLKDPNEADGSAKVDKNNEDESLRSQPILGLVLLQDFEWNDDMFEDGTIYDPENGKLYSCEITFENRDTLNVRGFIGFSLLGRTTVWTRAK